MKLFLFPLGHVLLYPGTSKPLQIFEPRYLQMVKDSISQQIPIAIGFVEEQGQKFMFEKGKKVEFVRDVVGHGHAQILETRPDGTLLILLVAEGKAKLGPLVDDSQPYLIVDAEPLPEDMTLSSETSASYLTLQKLLLSWLQTNIPDARARDQFRNHLLGPLQVVGCVANYLVSDPDMQQLVLEADHVDQKVNLLSGMVGQGQA